MNKSSTTCQMIKLSEIHMLENSRCDSFDYADLMASIKESGLVQPIVVAKNFVKGSKKPYVLVAGNRRYTALNKLGYKTTNAVMNTTVKNRADLLILNGIENLQREDITAYEQGRIFEQLKVKEGLSLREIAARMGMSYVKVSAILKAYHNTPAAFRDKVVLNAAASCGKAGTVSMSAATTILNAEKSGLVNRRQVNKLMKDVGAGVYGNEQIKNMVKDLKRGYTLEDIVNGRKELAMINVKMEISVKERDRLLKKTGLTLTDLIQQMVYGETKLHFKRPRLTTQREMKRGA